MTDPLDDIISAYATEAERRAAEIERVKYDRDQLRERLESLEAATLQAADRLRLIAASVYANGTMYDASAVTSIAAALADTVITRRPT